MLQLLRVLPTLLLFVATIIRVADTVPGLALATALGSAYGAALLFFCAAARVFVALLKMSRSLSPVAACALSVLAFAVVKGYADTLEVPSLTCGGSACVSLVTGANSGIGKATATLLAQQGHVTLMACRSKAACDAAADEVRAVARGARVLPVGGLDLASLAATRAWATTLAEQLKAQLGEGARLDYLFNNAGVMPVGAAMTADGIELGLGVSYVGPLALGRWLLEAGVLTPASTSVQTASEAARLGSLHASLWHGAGEGDLRGEITAGCAIPLPVCVPALAEMHLMELGGRLDFGAYPRAKLANVLYARELHARHGLRAVSAHPGMVDTPMAANVGHIGMLGALAALPTRLVLRPPEVAAAVLIRCAAAAVGAPGAYCNGRGEPLPDALLPPKFVDARSSARLWEVAEAAVRRFEAGEAA